MSENQCASPITTEDIHELIVLKSLQQWINNSNKTQSTPQALVLYSTNPENEYVHVAKDIAGGDDRFWILCDAVFDTEDFKKSTAKVLILKDMKVPHVDDIITWRDLIRSKSTVIPTLDGPITFAHGIPCIILTSNRDMVDFLRTDLEICKFVRILELRRPL